MANIVAIFAHPDDESFGPGGTLATLSQNNTVYTICATSGDAAGDPNVRESELKKACSHLGIKEVFFLRFQDGTLSNAQYHQIAEAVQVILDKLKPATVITFEQRGVSGHIDHVVMSMVTSFLFEKLPYIGEAWYFCISKEHKKTAR
ncbi:MAG: 1D-myo-inositol 2-acetamido-2-deoxy-alpha-D-glucopyranoside deacetylase [Microgenomates bacterium OLB23]|nr:MAG: 1D-myo-inositol 2-acetamido-2-deoxy-alpha-D-glucopyranoside deacetylase [Microgenomates bacterium OLB23]